MPFAYEDHPFRNDLEDSSRKVRDEAIGRIESRSLVDEGNTHALSPRPRTSSSLHYGWIRFVKVLFECAIGSSEALFFISSKNSNRRHPWPTPVVLHTLFRPRRPILSWLGKQHSLCTRSQPREHEPSYMLSQLSSKAASISSPGRELHRYNLSPG